MPLRAVLRFIASVAMVGGALLVAEAVVTVVWQEPISALIAARAQAGLGDDLDRIEVEALPERQGLSRRERAAAQARRLAEGVEAGDPIGRITMPTLDRDYVVVEGTSAGPLRKGPGHYADTVLPGQPGTVAIAGHRTTYLAPFRDVDDLAEGDPIVIEMPYGEFTYRVFQTRIVEPTDVWVKRSFRSQRLVLTACHPPFSAAQRIVVFARLDRFRLERAR